MAWTTYLQTRLFDAIQEETTKLREIDFTRAIDVEVPEERFDFLLREAQTLMDSRFGMVYNFSNPTLKFKGG